MAPVKPSDRTEAEYTKDQLGSTSEARGVVGVDSSDANEEVAIDHVFVHKHWRSERRSSHMDEVAFAVMHVQLAQRSCFWAHLLGEGVDRRCFVRARRHDDADFLWSNPGLIKLAQERWHDARGGRRAVQVVDDYDRASLASAKLPKGGLADRCLKSRRDLRLGQRFPYA